MIFPIASFFLYPTKKCLYPVYNARNGKHYPNDICCSVRTIIGNKYILIDHISLAIRSIVGNNSDIHDTRCPDYNWKSTLMLISNLTVDKRSKTLNRTSVIFRRSLLFYGAKDSDD